MANSRGFSIYLLKDIFTPENVLKDDHNLQLLEEENTNLPNNSIMYFSESPPKWKNYWEKHKDLYQM
jgi:hypothetical protein